MNQGQHPAYFGLRQTDILDRLLRRFKEGEAIGGIVKTITIPTIASALDDHNMDSCEN
jgi:hypothetical protein